MAEFVQQHLESMIPELEQLKRVGLFTESETRKILQKRRSFEYKLRRRTKQKEDYLQYIQYEINLLNLIKMRRRKINYKFKTKEIDVVIVMRIHSFFKAVCNRFQNDASLCLSHIEFAKSRQEKHTIGKLYANMLQIHNKNPKIWIEAAKWEIDQNNDMQNARALLLKALQFNRDSKILFKEYFRMELMNTEKLRQRRQILLAAKLDEQADLISDEVLQGRVAAVVFEQARELFPGDIDFFLSMVEICKIFSFTSPIQDLIFSDLVERHPTSEVVRKELCVRVLHDAELVKEIEALADKKERNAALWNLEEKCHEKFENAIQDLNTSTMWSLYIETCVQKLHLKSHGKRYNKRRRHLLRVFQCALDAGRLEEKLLIQWVRMLLDSEKEKASQALQVIQQGNDLYPQSVALWKEHLTCRMALEPKNHKAIIDVFHGAIKKIQKNLKESLPLWETMISWTNFHCLSEVQAIFESGMNIDCVEVCRRLKELYILWMGNTHKMPSVRELYSRLKGCGPVSKEFFNLYIQIERQQISQKRKHIRAAYEDAILSFGASSPDVWLDYIKYETKEGSTENVGKLHFRAKSALQGDNVDKFITHYTLMQIDLV